MRVRQIRVWMLMVLVAIVGPLLAVTIGVVSDGVPVEVLGFLAGLVLLATVATGAAWLLLEANPDRRRICTCVFAFLTAMSLLLGSPVLWGVWLFHAHGLPHS